MKTFLKLIKWDFTLQLRYNIITIAVIISILYIIMLKSLPGNNLDALVILLVLSDPTMFGVLFIGVLVLYEKDNNTLNALVVTPIKPWQYLWAKAFSLTIIAVPIALGISIFGHGINIRYLYLLISVILSSFMFVFLGFAIVSNIKGFNQYIIKFALFTLPVSIPVLGLFNLYHSSLYYLIPTQATIILLKAAFGSNVNNWQLIYSISYLLVWLAFSFYLSLNSYHKNLLNQKRHE